MYAEAYENEPEFETFVKRLNGDVAQALGGAPRVIRLRSSARMATTEGAPR